MPVKCFKTFALTPTHTVAFSVLALPMLTSSESSAFIKYYLYAYVYSMFLGKYHLFSSMDLSPPHFVFITPFWIWIAFCFSVEFVNVSAFALTQGLIKYCTTGVYKQIRYT